MKRSAEVVIIGGGISGCSIAYHLAAKGVKDIVVIEKAYLTSGATGRCGAGVRQQWGTPMNCDLAKRSVDFFEHATEILQYDGDIQFKQEGYLVVASSKEEDALFKENAALQNKYGIPTQHLSKEDALKIVPYLNIDEVTSANFCPTDGHLNPFTTTDAFYHAAKRLGVTFYTYTTVLDIETKHQRIEAVVTDKGTIATRTVVNAAGGWAQVIGQMVGVDIPVYSENHEILVTEPVERMLSPMVISFSKNIYCQQTPHGPFIMGRSDPNMPKGLSMHSTWGFLEAMAKTATSLLPPLKDIRVLRQWGGLYNMSPDHQPILSGVDTLPGFYIACGFSGHGFMLAPMTGILISEMILNETPTVPLEPLSMERFKHPHRIVKEKSVV